MAAETAIAEYSTRSRPLATEVTNQAAEVGALAPMTANLEAAGIEGAPTVVLADAGSCSEANLAWIDDSEHDVLVATGRIKAGERVADYPRGPIPADTTRRERMAGRLRTKNGRPVYARRKAIVEPALGQMKEGEFNQKLWILDFTKGATYPPS